MLSRRGPCCGAQSMRVGVETPQLLPKSDAALGKAAQGEKERWGVAGVLGSIMRGSKRHRCVGRDDMVTTGSAATSPLAMSAAPHHPAGWTPAPPPPRRESDTLNKRRANIFLFT